MGLLRLAGFRAVRITSTWEPGLVAPSEHEAAILANVAAAAALHGVRVYVSVYHAGSLTTPLTVQAQSEFAAYVTELLKSNEAFRDVIVGNEPNLNRFWLPQFRANGTGASAPAYNSLLAKTYDAVKEAVPETVVWGGALAPRGVDKPLTGRDTISPTRFIREWGATYRASRRTRPVMDGFAFHPYGQNSSVAVDRLPGDRDHLGLVDQDRLVQLLGSAFNGTAQKGSGLPILYDEYGIESVIPADKAALYVGLGARHHPAGLGDRAGGRLREGAPARVLPVERRRGAALPLVRRAVPRRLAVRALLRRRDAEDVARHRARHARRDRERDARRVPGPRQAAGRVRAGRP